MSTVFSLRLFNQNYAYSSDLNVLITCIIFAVAFWFTFKKEKKLIWMFTIAMYDIISCSGVNVLYYYLNKHLAEGVPYWARYCCGNFYYITLGSMMCIYISYICLMIDLEYRKKIRIAFASVCIFATVVVLTLISNLTKFGIYVDPDSLEVYQSVIIPFDVFYTYSICMLF